MAFWSLKPALRAFRGLLQMMLTLHSSAQGVKGSVGVTEDQWEMDLLVLGILSMIADNDTHTPHEELILQKIVFTIMHDILEGRPSFEKRTATGAYAPTPATTPFWHN